MSLSCLINAACLPAPLLSALFCQQCRVAPARLSEMCICITCHSQGGMIDVWICLRRRDCLSHGSVRQNMCEQKWGHLGRIRNCEEEEEKIMIKLYEHFLDRIPVPRVCCVFIWQSVSGYVCVCVFLCVFLSVLLYSLLCVWRRDCEIFLFCASSNVSQPSKATGWKWQVYRCGLTGLIRTLYELCRDQRVRLHPEVRLRSTGTYARLLSTES